MKLLVTQARIHEVLNYDSLTGEFGWRQSGRGRLGIPGTISPAGYRIIRIDGRCYMAHRLAWLYVHGRWPNFEIDHKNRVRLDNRMENLREASRSENTANSSTARNALGFKGVRWHKASQSYVAAIKTNGRSKHLGCFKTPEAAHFAYRAAALENYGLFATF